MAPHPEGWHLIARGRGWRWPLVTLEIWSGASEQVAEVSAALVLQLVIHHLQALTLREALQREITTVAMVLPTPEAIEIRRPLRAVNGRRLRGLISNAKAAPP